MQAAAERRRMAQDLENMITDNLYSESPAKLHERQKYTGCLAVAVFCHMHPLFSPRDLVAFLHIHLT